MGVWLAALLSLSHLALAVLQPCADFHIVTQGFAGGSLAQGPPGHQAGSLGCVPAGADIRQLLSAAWLLLHARLLIPLRILIPRRISNLRL